MSYIKTATITLTKGMSVHPIKGYDYPPKTNKPVMLTRPFTGIFYVHDRDNLLMGTHFIHYFREPVKGYAGFMTYLTDMQYPDNINVDDYNCEPTGLVHFLLL